MTNVPNDSSKPKLPPSLTGQILNRFGEALLESGKFDLDTVTKLLQLARAESKPKAKDFEELIRREEPLE